MPRIILVRSSGPPREASEREREPQNRHSIRVGLTTPKINRVSKWVQKEKTVTENVSPHGARVTTARCWQPGTRVLVTLPRNGVQFEGRVAYCQRKASGVFAIGVEVAA